MKQIRVNCIRSDSKCFTRVGSGSGLGFLGDRIKIRVNATQIPGLDGLETITKTTFIHVISHKEMSSSTCRLTLSAAESPCLHPEILPRWTDSSYTHHKII